MRDGDATARVRRQWDQRAARYDRGERLERVLLRDTRAWLCGRADGRTLEIAMGTGRNLPHYDPGVGLTGVDLSPRMLEEASHRARRLGRDVELREADAQHLPFADAIFHTVVCALALCAIPDQRVGIDEMWRVLKPGGRVLLVDHVEYTRLPFRWVERRRGTPRSRPLDLVRDRGFVIERHERLAWGFIDRLVARRPE